MVTQTASKIDEKRAQLDNIIERTPAAKELWDKLEGIPEANKYKIIEFVFVEIPNTPFDGKTWDEAHGATGEVMLDEVLGASGEATEAISTAAHRENKTAALDAAGDAARDAVLAAVRKAVGDAAYNAARAAARGALGGADLEALREALGDTAGNAPQSTAQGAIGKAAEEVAGKVAWWNAVQEAAYNAALWAGAQVLDSEGEDRYLADHIEYARGQWNECAKVLISTA
jgi:hypothetical protein